MGTDKPGSSSPGQDQSNGLWAAGPEGPAGRMGQTAPANTLAREMGAAAGRGGTMP